MESNKVAIIGMSGRFPDANSVEELFKNCLDGVISIREYSDDELIEEGIKKESINKDNYVKYGAFVKDIDKFDNDFFKMTQIEANLVDPQQRMFLKCSWEALENASYDPDKFKGNIGVFASSSISTYFINNILKSEYYKNKDFDYMSLIGNNNDTLSTRVSYKLGLTGPSISIQSACSSSLAAVHYACESLKNSESDMAIVGGSSLTVPQKMGYLYKEGSNFSKDGQIRAFDSKASGMVKGNGCGVVILKLLDKAIEDKDYIYAVIDSSAINNDGKNKVGYTAPSVSGQSNAIKKAISKSGIDVNKIRYIETHGTGTKLGDPIEVRALSNSYNMDKENKAIIGSIKSNIGHLDAAAGVTSLIKAAMILDKGVIPKSVNFDTPNPQINFDNIPFYVEPKENVSLNKCEKNYVGVSSFGIGGTNLHVILEDYKREEIKGNENRMYILPVSAKTETALNKQKSNLKEFLQSHKELNIEDIAFSLCFGRKHFSCRDYVMVSSIKEAIQQLDGEEIQLNKDSTLVETAEEWKNGKNVSWEFLFEGINAHRIPLPSYPFEEKSFWIKPLVESMEEVAIDKEDNILDLNKLSREDVINEVIKIWSEDLEMEIEEDDDFFDMGGDSLIAIDIICDLNDKFKIKLDTNVLSELSTVKLISNYIYENTILNSFKDFNNINKIISSTTSDKSLFLVHPSGGSTYCYNVLGKYLNKDINIYAISFPENIDLNLTITDLAKIYASQIQQIRPEGDIYLGGYSFGGNVAIEIAMQLIKEQRNIGKIFMIDSLVPDSYSKEGINREKCIKNFPVLLNLLIGNIKKAELLMDNDTDKDFDQVINDMKNEGKISNKIPNEKIIRMFNSWISNNNALSSQVLNEKIDIPITIFYAQEQLPTFLREFTKLKYVSHEVWSKYTTKELTSFCILGNHYTMMSEESNLKQLADCFNKEIKKLI